MLGDKCVVVFRNSIRNAGELLALVSGTPCLRSHADRSRLVRTRGQPFGVIYFKWIGRMRNSPVNWTNQINIDAYTQTLTPRVLNVLTCARTLTTLGRCCRRCCTLQPFIMSVCAQTRTFPLSNLRSDDRASSSRRADKARATMCDMQQPAKFQLFALDLELQVTCFGSIHAGVSYVSTSSSGWSGFVGTSS